MMKDKKSEKNKKTNKKTAEYAFIDDNDTIVKAKVDERQKIKKNKSKNS